MTDAERAARPRSTRTPARSSSSSRTSSARSRTSRRWPRRPRRRAPCVVVRLRPDRRWASSSRPASAASTSRVGEGQTLGNRLDFGGPSLRLLRRDRGVPAPHARPHRRRDPRRRRPPRLRPHAADARAAHPPREGDVEHLHRPGAQRAGRRRLPELAGPARDRRARASCMLQRTPTRARRSPRSTGVERCHEQPVVREFAVRLDAPVERVIERCQSPRASTRASRSTSTTPSSATGCWSRSPSSARARTSTGWRRCWATRSPPSAARARRWARDHERQPPARDPEIEARPRRRASDALRDPCSASRGDDLREGPRGPARVRRAGARRARAPVDELLPERFRRAQPPRLPEVAEPELVRHYVRLSKRNFDLDSGFYPLGSCTMKHNPRLHERVAALPGHARLHPLQRPDAGAGRARADVEPRARAGRDRRPAARLAAAQRRLARRARRRAAHPRLPRGPRRAPRTRSSRPTPRTGPTRRR